MYVASRPTIKLLFQTFLLYLLLNARVPAEYSTEGLEAITIREKQDGRGIEVLKIIRSQEFN